MRFKDSVGTNDASLNFRLLLQSHSLKHVCLCTSQSHSANVTCLDFSSNGKYLASCADDRTVRIWSTKDFLEREHKCLRANVELDHATLVRFSPDSRSPPLFFFMPHFHCMVWHDASQLTFDVRGLYREASSSYPGYCRVIWLRK